MAWRDDPSKSSTRDSEGVHLKRWIDGTLWLLFLASIGAVVLGMDDPFARHWICEHIRSCPLVRNPDAWKKLIYDLGVAGLTSLLFYGLLVRLPECERRSRIKRTYGPPRLQVISSST